ncbi:MAG: GxxExxY protein [Prevotellaceae bacterium]|jgi:GxxExxY protein|nr:GxxExxY protein [Prevotellaceae bacterium]
MGIIYKTESYNIIGAAMEVHRVLGCGFLEAIYQEAMEKEFMYRKMPYKREKKLEIYYKEELLSQFYVADFICYDKIVVELKALNTISSLEEAQMLNYLKATNFKVGILLNFGERSLVYKRLVY